MQLIGSRTEDEFRKELTKSYRALVAGDERARLRSILQVRGVDVFRCMVVNWIPDQGEDVFDVLHSSEVLRVEIPHESSEAVVQSESLTDYMTGRHGRPQRIKLAVALDMLQKGLNDAV